MPLSTKVSNGSTFGSRRFPPRIPKKVKEVKDELDPYVNEARAYCCIERSCTSCKRIYFPEFHGVITDPERSKFTYGFINPRAVVLELIRPKLESRRILAAHRDDDCELQNQLKNIRPKDDYTWHIRRGRLLDSYESVWMSYTANGSGQTALHFVSDLEYTQNITVAKRRYLLCLVPKEWGVEDVRSPLMSIYSSLPRHAHSYINTRIDLKNWNRA